MKLPVKLYEQVVMLARVAAPDECCGVIAGADGLATKIYPARNVAEQPHYAYEMEASGLWAITTDMAESGSHLLAIYHSHPHHVAFPSQTDIRLAFYPDAVYLIVGLTTDPPEVNAYHIRDGVVSLADVGLA